jgi:hypothetical protein
MVERISWIYSYLMYPQKLFFVTIIHKHVIFASELYPKMEATGLSESFIIS